MLTGRRERRNQVAGAAMGAAQTVRVAYPGSGRRIGPDVTARSYAVATRPAVLIGQILADMSRGEASHRV